MEKLELRKQYKHLYGPSASDPFKTAPEKLKTVLRHPVERKKMNRDEIILLFDYGYWANERILKAAENLTRDQYTAAVPGLSMGSTHATLVHTLAAERIWRQRIVDGLSPTTLLSEADTPTFDALRQLWAEEEAAMRAGLAGLTDEALAGRLAYRMTNGQPNEETLWQLLAHLVNHGTQHRAEAAVALTAFGCSPGDVDLIVYMRGKKPTT